MSGKDIYDEIFSSDKLVAEPLCSIVVLVYNHEKFLRECLDSLVSQKCEYPFEIVIGEDASSDGSREIILDYQKKYPHLIKAFLAKNNIGVLANVANVYKACRGKYIALCEGDDYWIDQRKLEKQVDYLEKHPECGLVHSDYNMLYEESGVVAERELYHHSGGLSGKCFDKYWNTVGRNLAIKTLTVCMRSCFLGIYETIAALGTEQNWVQGDFQLFISIAHKSEIGFLPEATAMYRARSFGSATSSDGGNLAKIMRSFESFAKSREFLIEYLDLDYDSYKTALLEDYKTILKYAFMADVRDTFDKYYSKLNKALASGERPGFFYRCLNTNFFWNKRLFRKLLLIKVNFSRYARILVKPGLFFVKLKSRVKLLKRCI